MLRISRDAMYQLAKNPDDPLPDPLHRWQDARRHHAARRARRVGRAQQRRRLDQNGLAPMAAAGPRGRDGPSPREFTVIRHFMMANLGLSGLPLLVYAHIFGFCDGGCDYFESKSGLTRFLNVQERSVHRASRDLLDRDLIEDYGVEIAGDLMSLLVRLENSFGIVPATDGTELSLSAKAPRAPKAAMAIKLWADKRAQLEDGEIDANEYED